MICSLIEYCCIRQDFNLFFKIRFVLVWCSIKDPTINCKMEVTLVYHLFIYTQNTQWVDLTSKFTRKYYPLCIIIQYYRYYF